MATARLRHLWYAYGAGAAPALDDVSLELGEGLTLVTGASGGGKSTLLRVLNGLVPHFHGGRIGGTAQSAGLDVLSTPTRLLARRVGFVFQDPELQAVYDTVEREVAFGLENTNVPAAAMAGRIDDALAQTGIQHLRSRRLSTLSGGERQRVALSSVLAMQPRTVVLDEPSSQLDPEGAALVLDATVRIKESGRAVVIAEHRLDRLAAIAELVLEVALGRVERAHANGVVTAVDVRRGTAAGAEAWALHAVSAGFAGRAVLAGVDLAGRQGEVVALCGPNGGGKTTLLRTIAGVLKPLEGTVQRQPGRIAYLPQNPTAILHRPTVRSEVELTLARSGEKDQAGAILGELGLREVAERYPRDLSSGERQRAAIAAVLAGRPRLVLLDEPTRGMDVAARIALTRLVARLRDEGAAVVLATHDQTLRDSLADRTLYVCDGGVSE